MSDRRVRVRFAPSPTGPLHMGGVRTALFNYLFAKHHGGDFVLRIEDTDQTRFVEGAEKYIVEAMEWCGIPFDESPEKGGKYGPYRQSERKEVYLKYALQLVNDGKAYYAFDTPEQLTAMRERLEAENSSVRQYNAVTRGTMTNSFTLSADEVKAKIDAGEPYVIRFNMPADELVEMTDIVRGHVKVNTKELDDKVLYKSADKLPTYHLANIVDDHLMEISHVIRGEEWLPSMPLHVMLYRALGWEETMPEFAHLSLLLKPSGKGKLSKRDGDKLGFPVFPLEWKDPKTESVAMGYREQGYFADAFVNILALLGWNPGTEQELFTLEELIKAFDLTKVSKSGARFDHEKTKWFNQQYVRLKSDAELAAIFAVELSAKGITADKGLTERVVALTKERVEFASDFWEQASFFFQAPSEYDAKVVKKRWKEGVSEKMTELKEVLAATEDFSSINTETVVKEWLNEKEYNMGQIMNCFRLSLVGAGKGPHLFDISEILGKEETILRIEKAVAAIQK